MRAFTSSASAARLGVAAALVFCASIADCPAQLIISEYRLQGPNGVRDEFIEIYNNSGADHTVTSGGGSTGYAVAASDGSARFFIPNGTVIPNRGHYLGCNSVGYSLASYPAGSGATATCDATYTLDIPINSGIAIFNTTIAGNFVLANRMDAVGSTATANTTYKEGTGVRNLTTNTLNYSYVRKFGGGCIGTSSAVVDSNCTDAITVDETPESVTSTPVDTNSNRADFIFVAPTVDPTVNAASEGTQQRLGAPNPENLSSPIMRHSALRIELVDPGTCSNCPPNRVRDMTNDPAVTGDSFGSIFVRRKIVNNTGGNVTRLRFRIAEITTFPAAVFTLGAPPNDTCGSDASSCVADLRALTSSDTIVAVSGGGTVTVRGTTLEQASGTANLPNGGGYHSTLSAGTVTLGTPLAANDNPSTANVKENEIHVQFKLGVEQQGLFRFSFLIEVLP